MKYIARIETAESEFELFLNGTRIVARLSDGTIEEPADSEFSKIPSDKECVEWAYASYDAPGFEIVDCIEYED